MDKLKQLIANSKPKTKLTIQKQQIEQKKEQFMKQQKQALRVKEQQKIKHLSQIQQFYNNGYGKPRKQVKITTQQTQNKQIPISVQQVKQKLRKLYQPVTIFGQSAWHRYNRLIKAEKFNQSHPNQDMKLYDQQFSRIVKENQQYEELDAKYRQYLVQPALLADPILRKKKQNMIFLRSKAIKQEKDEKIRKKNYEIMCDKVHLWIRKVLRAWGQALQINATKSKIKDHNFKSQLYQQTNDDISSLFPVLRQHKGDPQMIQSLYHIANCCLIRQYVQANTRYIQLSIGNAPWPMGVAMLGITVRKNAQKLSYVLDNQITRKWMLGVKRLITVSQELYPNQDRMKMANYTVHKCT